MRNGIVTLAGLLSKSEMKPIDVRKNLLTNGFFQDRRGNL
jgi:hypothetical protein